MKMSWFFAVMMFLAGAALMSLNSEESLATDTPEAKGAKKEESHGDAKKDEAKKEDGKEGDVKTEEAKKEGAPDAEKEERKPAAATEDFQEPSNFSNAQPPADGSLPAPSAIADVKKQREILSRREKELEAREEDLKKKEQAIASELEKLEALRNDIAKIDESRRKENEEKVAKLVETLETMSPKSASQLVANIDEALAVSAMTKMTTPKLAKIMNIMDPQKSSRLTELMSGVISRRNAASARAPASESLKPSTSKNLPEKGGEKNDGKNTELSNPDAQSGGAKSPGSGGK